MNLYKHSFQLAVVALALVAAPAARAQQAYPSPDAAAEALVDGIARHDGDALRKVIGADYAKYVPTAKIGPDDVTAFLEAWAQSHRIVSTGPDRAYLGAGRYGWTLPIPIVKSAAGWRFDTRAAPGEMRLRRIGRNELSAIQVALAYADAQDEYLANNAGGTRAYAARGLSTPGKRDGLYWATLPGEAPSPLGPDFAQAKPGQPFHGYLYRILTAQGKDAPGGAKSYLKAGRMTEGYALIAYPARYGETGVMSFIVNRDGVVYQKDLGPGNGPAGVTAYNPDGSWTKVAARK